MDDEMRTLFPRQNAEQVASRLFHELEEARANIVSLAPAPYDEMLCDYWKCTTQEQASTWSFERAERIIAAMHESGAAPPAHETPWPSTHDCTVACPLCAAVPQHSYRDGFTFPEGLRRHLTGFGRMQQCPVMEAGAILARQHYRLRSAHTAKVTEERVEHPPEAPGPVPPGPTPASYRIAPDAPARTPSRTRAMRRRTAESEQQALDRLASMGFQAGAAHGVHTLSRQWRDMTVLADPTVPGRLEFQVFFTPHPGAPPGQPVGTVTLDLPDRYKHDLEHKLIRRLEHARLILRRSGASPSPSP